MACNATSVWFSKLSTLRLHFAQMRFGKPLSSFNVISDRALILDASLSWLAFFYQTMLLYGGYKPQRIHKGGKLMLFSLLARILSEHTPLNNVNVINVSNAILINQKRISVYRAKRK